MSFKDGKCTLSRNVDKKTTTLHAKKKKAAILETSHKIRQMLRPE